MSSVKVHISLNEELVDKIKYYCDVNRLNFSEGVRTISEKGFENIELKLKIDNLETLIAKINNKINYLKDLIEQLYANLEIENNVDPKSNKSLQKFKTDRYKDKIND